MGNGYGNITKVKTSGASKKTSEANKLTYSGERASHAMAKEDSGRMEKYMSKIKTVAEEKEIDPALIAAIISRESRAGKGLENGRGDYDPSRGEYNAWGLMQVDVNPNGGGHKARGDWDSLKHLRQATQILVDFIKVFRNECDDWSTEEQLKGGIAAYNIGDGKVDKEDPEKVDKKTTGGDYSNDVVARAQWYKSNSGTCNIC